MHVNFDKIHHDVERSPSNQSCTQVDVEDSEILGSA